ncbi:MAG: hypothetical protein J6D11_08585 [Clostridia bacterium]|nr:hypothetical protein [Clostridia bacterium]
MNNNRISFRERMIRFMYGRNGVDTLCNVLMITYAVLAVIDLFIGSVWLSLATLALAVYAIFRMMSHNVAKRRAENARFCGMGRKIKQWFKRMNNKFRDRKTHVYRKCPHCKNTLRLPKVKGMHTVNCPCCHNKFDVKI